MIIATYVENKPYLVECLKLWRFTARRFASELWVATPTPEFFQEMLPDAVVFGVEPFEPKEYVGGNCSKLTSLPFPDEHVLLTDPDVVFLQDPNIIVCDTFSAVLFQKGKRFPKSPFIRGTYDEGWERVATLLPSSATQFDYFNTGVLSTTGTMIKAYRDRYMHLTGEIWSRRGELGIGHWIPEQVAHAVAVAETETRVVPLAYHWNAQNTEEYEAYFTEEPAIIHYCWKDNRNFDKIKDMNPLSKFVTQNTGGPLVSKVREIAKEYMRYYE